MQAMASQIHKSSCANMDTVREVSLASRLSVIGTISLERVDDAAEKMNTVQMK